MNLILIVSSLIVITNCEPQYPPEYRPVIVYPTGRIAPWMKVVPGNVNTRIGSWVHDHLDLDHLNEHTRFTKPQTSGAKDYYCKDQFGNKVPCKGQDGFVAPSVESSPQQSPQSGVVDVRKPRPGNGEKGTNEDKSVIQGRR